MAFNDILSISFVVLSFAVSMSFKFCVVISFVVLSCAVSMSFKFSVGLCEISTAFEIVVAEEI